MTDIDDNKVAQEFAQIEQRRADMALSEARMWLWMSPLLAFVFLVISAMQAYWALHDLSGMGDDGSAFSAIIVGLIAVGLIAGSNVMSIEFGTQGGIGKLLSAPLLIGLIGFSFLTSAMHLAGEVIGGHEASVTSSPQYRLANESYESAMINLKAIERSAALADEKGDTGSAGHIRSKQLPSAEQRLSAARADLNQVATSGKAGADAIVLTEIAALAGMAPSQFEVAFSLAAVLLMELLRIWLTIKSATLIRNAIAGAKFSPKPRAGIAPELRAVA